MLEIKPTAEGIEPEVSRPGLFISEPTPYGKKTHLRFRGRGVYPTEGSCRFPLIVLQQTTQSFLATHDSVIPARPSIRQWDQQPVLLALVIALLVVMGHILLQGSAQRPLPEQDELRTGIPASPILPSVPHRRSNSDSSPVGPWFSPGQPRSVDGTRGRTCCPDHAVDLGPRGWTVIQHEDRLEADSA